MWAELAWLEGADLRPLLGPCKLLHHKTSGKTKNQMGGCGPEGCITATEDKKMEEKS